MSSACPKCSGSTGRYQVETIKREHFQAWDGAHLSYGDEMTIETSRWRCVDCNAYRIDTTESTAQRR